MFTSLASVVLLLALDSAIPVAPAPAPSPLPPAVTVEAAVVTEATLPIGEGSDVAAADLEPGGIVSEAAPMSEPVCIQTYCKRKSLRCDFTGVHPTQQCCQYNCYADSSCTTAQNPPNVCGLILLP